MLLCEIATPTKRLFHGEVALVEAPGAEGSFGVLPGHEAFACRMNNGKVTLFTDAARTQKIEFASYQGFAQVSNDKVTILSDKSVALEGMDTAKVASHLDELKAQLEQAKAAPADDRAAAAQVENLTAEVEWHELMLALAK